MTKLNLQDAKYSLATDFGQADLPVSATIAGFTGFHPAVQPKEFYVWQRSKLRDFLAFWQTGMNALKIKGDPATGKTSIVEQWHATLGWPLRKLPCSRGTEQCHLIGQMLPVANGTLQWFDGPVLAAAREGTSVLLDEYNTLEPEQSTSLNMLLEGKSITIPQTGEVVRPEPGFRVFATENDVQSRLSVTGRNVQDAANNDRWMVMRVDYLPAELEEVAVLQALLRANVRQDKAELCAKSVVKLANQVRLAYRNEEDGIEMPMSTRTVIRWALLIHRFQKVPVEEGGPTLYALNSAFDMPAEMKGPVNALAKAVFGSS